MATSVTPQAISVPKVGPTPGGKPGTKPVRVLNRASGKMETKAQMRAYKPPAVHARASAGAQALGAPRAAKTPARRLSGEGEGYTGKAVLNPGGFGKQELINIERGIAKSTKAQEQANLKPYQQRQGELSNIEGTVAGRYAGYNQQALGALKGLTGEAEGSAKTFENQAAENALQAQKSVETAGQNTATANAGYLDPQVRAAQEAGVANVAGLGAAATARAGEQGQGQVGFLRNLAAAAALRGTEGQGTIASHYGAERAKVGKEEANVTAREQARSKNELITLPKELLTTKLGVQKLANEGVKLNQKSQEIGIKGREAGTKSKAQAATERYQQQQVAWKIAGLTGTERQRAIQNRINEGKLKVSELSQADKSAYDRYKEGRGVGGKGTASGIKYSSANALKFHADVGKIEAAARSLGDNLQASPQKIAEVRAELLKKNVDTNLISAALNKIRYGRLGPNDKKYAKSIGAEP